MNILIPVTLLLCVSTLACICTLVNIFVLTSHTDVRHLNYNHINNTLATISRQLMIQQLYMEEKARSEGDSGLKITRLKRIGPRAYHAESHSSPNMVCEQIQPICMYVDLCSSQALG